MIFIFLITFTYAQYVLQFISNLTNLSSFATTPKTAICNKIKLDYVVINSTQSSPIMNIFIDKPHYYIYLYVDFILLGSWNGESASISIDNINAFSFPYTIGNGKGNFCVDTTQIQSIITQNLSFNHFTQNMQIQFALNKLSATEEPFKLGIRNLQLNVSLCHPTCLTCVGPLETDCSTCAGQKNKKNNTCRCPENKKFIDSQLCVSYCSDETINDDYGNCYSSSLLINTESSLNGSFNYGYKNISTKWQFKNINGTTKEQLQFQYQNQYLIGLFKCKQQLIIGQTQLTGHYKVRVRFMVYAFHIWAVGEYIQVTLNSILQKPITYTINGFNNYLNLTSCTNENTTNCELMIVEFQQSHIIPTLTISIYSDTYSQSQARWALSQVRVDILQCVQNCGDCYNDKICNTCENGYFLYKNTCVQNCPSQYTTQVNDKCLELDEQIQFSKYLLRLLVNTTLQGTSQLQNTYYNGYRQLSGISATIPNFYKFKFYNLKPHYQIRGSLKIDMINYGQIDSGYIVIFSNEYRDQIYINESKLTEQYIRNFTLGHFTSNFTFDIVIAEDTNKLFNQFRIGISNIMVTVDECYPTCTACFGPTQEECTQWSIEPYFLKDQLSCSNNLYFSNGQCQECLNSNCLQCNEYEQCLQCQVGYVLSGYICYCAPGYYQDQDNNCYACYSNCKNCKGPEQDDCLELSSKEIDCDLTAGFQWGQQCNDGNTFSRDGCSNCIIDIGWSCINTINEYSTCIKCPDNCESCQLRNDQQIECLSCNQGYFQYKDGCNQCKTGCAQCDYIDQCTLCSVSSITPLNGKCSQCDNNQGLYYNATTNACNSICGDFIQAIDEECDDGNLMNGDGCSSLCQIENGFECTNNVCQQSENTNMQLKYSNKTTTNTLKLDFGDYPTKCDEKYLTVYLEGFETKDFKVYLKLIADGNDQYCQISFKFYRSVKSYDMIHVLFYKNLSRLLVDFDEFIIQARPEDYYSDENQEIAQSILSFQNSLVNSLYFLGPATLLLGGFNFFFNILDIMAWLNNFYYLNVMYPPNVNIIFLNPAWEIINPFDYSPIQRDEGDTDYIEAPFRFEQKGVDPYFLNNMTMSFFTWLLCIMLFPLCKGLVIGIEKFYQRSPRFKIKMVQTKQVPVFQLDQSIIVNSFNQSDEEVKVITPKKYPFIVQYFYDNAYEYQSSFKAIMIKQLNLIYLDLCMASILQLQYINKSEYIMIFSQILLSIIGLTICIVAFLVAIHVSYQSSLLLNTDQYKYIFGTLYEGINVESESAKKYFSISFARKMLFIIFLVSLYNFPLFQTSFCCAASFLNLMLLIYKNPFESKVEYIQNAIPDATIFFVLIICIVFAYDDQEQRFSSQDRINMGWLMLSFIGISVLTQFLLIFRQYLIDLKDSFEWIKSKICKT